LSRRFMRFVDNEYPELHPSGPSPYCGESKGPSETTVVTNR